MPMSLTGRTTRAMSEPTLLMRMGSARHLGQENGDRRRPTYWAIDQWCPGLALRQAALLENAVHGEHLHAVANLMMQCL
jgi:hypothetical protein